MDIETIFRWPPTPAKWRAIKEYLLSQRIHAGNGLRATKGSTGILLKTSARLSSQSSSMGDPGPLTPIVDSYIQPGEFEEPDEQVFFVTVTPGRIIERIPGIGDAVIPHEIGNHYYTEEEENLEAIPPIVAGAPRRFVVQPGAGVVVKVYVDENGAIAAPDPEDPASFSAEIMVEPTPDTLESLHYVPPVDGEEGVVGYYYYVLGIMTLARDEFGEVIDPPPDDFAPEVELVCGGSHLNHWRERHMVRNLGYGEKVAKAYNDDLDEYENRTLLGGRKAGAENTASAAALGQIDVATVEDEIVIRGNRRELKVLVSEADGETVPPTPSASADFAFSDGLCVSGAELENPAVPPEGYDPATEEYHLVLPVVDVAGELALDVTTANRKYVVRGNSIDQEINLVVNGGAPVKVLEFTDGLFVWGQDIAVDGAAGPEGPPGPPGLDGGSSYHPWKVSDSEGDDESTPPLRIWNVAIDPVWGQGGPLNCPVATVAGNAGSIWLEILRDSASREMTAVALVFEDGADPITTDTHQYRLIAKVDVEGDPMIIQYQFEEIRIHELMIVENGEFSLSGFEMSHRNTYAPPV